MPHPRRRRQGRGGEDGFTVLEMTIALALSAFVLSALASLLGSSLRTLSVHKARTQGNEVATQGIEDLQHLAYDRLGLCAAPGGTAPAGLSDTVLLNNCVAPVSRYQPCPDPGGYPVVGDVPAESYSCPRRNIDFEVRRYVAWGDLLRTEKVLAVYVRWTDSVGTHEVSQQSSLRIPNRAEIVGLAPPSVVTTKVTPTSNTIDTAGYTIDPVGLMAVPLALEATVAKPSPSGTDTVVASFFTLESGAPTTRSVTLAEQPGVCVPAPPTGGRCYTGSVPANSFTFGSGSQHFTFTVIRTADAKVNSRVYTPAVQFCPSGGCPTAPPSIAGALVPSSTTVDINAAGSLVADLVVEATTVNVTSTDSVSVVLETLSGAKTISLTPVNPNFPCVLGTCTERWRAIIPVTAGYLFPAGAGSIYFAAAQTVGPDPIDVGSTTASALSGLTFS